MDFALKMMLFVLKMMEFVKEIGVKKLFLIKKLEEGEFCVNNDDSFVETAEFFFIFLKLRILTQASRNCERTAPVRFSNV